VDVGPEWVASVDEEVMLVLGMVGIRWEPFHTLVVLVGQVTGTTLLLPSTEVVARMDHTHLVDTVEETTTTKALRGLEMPTLNAITNPNNNIDRVSILPFPSKVPSNFVFFLYQL
jgi:hypothetical protein